MTKSSSLSIPSYLYIIHFRGTEALLEDEISYLPNNSYFTKTSSFLMLIFVYIAIKRYWGAPEVRINRPIDIPRVEDFDISPGVEASVARVA